MKEPLVKMLCHRGPVTGIAIDAGGWSMATVAMDARLKIWDIRSTYKYVENCMYTLHKCTCRACMDRNDYIVVVLKDVHPFVNLYV